MLLRSKRGVAWRAGRLSCWLPIDERWLARLDLPITLVRRDWKAWYKRSVLGNLWLLLNQLSQLLIYTNVVSIVLKGKLSLASLPASNLIKNSWLLAGLLRLIAFTSGFSQAANSVVGQPNLVKPMVVPVLSAFIESKLGLMALTERMASLSSQSFVKRPWISTNLLI